MKKMLKKTAAKTEQERFLKSSRYAKLPDEEKEVRKSIWMMRRNRRIRI